MKFRLAENQLPAQETAAVEAAMNEPMVCQSFESLANDLRTRRLPGWFIYRGGSHLAIHRDRASASVAMVLEDDGNDPRYSNRAARRQLADLANILEHLRHERWDNPAERAAVLDGLATWPDVLRAIRQNPNLAEPRPALSAAERRRLEADEADCSPAGPVG